MNFVIQFFNVVLYQPLLNFLVLIYLFVPGKDFGIAVIILTIIIKLILHPSSKKSIQSQKAMAALQPKIKAIQEKFKDDKAAQARATMELYKTEKVSPASGCLPLLIQLPVFIALYQVFRNGLLPETLNKSLYSFVPFSGEITSSFLGFLDLSRPFYAKIEGTAVYYWPVLGLALLAAVVQFIQAKHFTPKTAPLKSKAKGQGPDISQMMQTQMIYFLPLLTIFIIIQFGSIIGLYWLTSSIFTIAEHYLLEKRGAKRLTGVPS